MSPAKAYSLITTVSSKGFTEIYLDRKTTSFYITSKLPQSPPVPAASDKAWLFSGAASV